MLWIAAKDNKRNKIGYPAGLASVVGVDMDFFEDPMHIFASIPGRSLRWKPVVSMWMLQLRREAGSSSRERPLPVRR
jgi:hypothetical protein